MSKQAAYIQTLDKLQGRCSVCTHTPIPSYIHTHACKCALRYSLFPPNRYSGVFRVQPACTGTMEVHGSSHHPSCRPQLVLPHATRVLGCKLHRRSSNSYPASLFSPRPMTDAFPPSVLSVFPRCTPTTLQDHRPRATPVPLRSHLLITLCELTI